VARQVGVLAQGDLGELRDRLPITRETTAPT
jgi:hypothetical protein